MKTTLIPRENHLIWIRYLAAFAILFSHSRVLTSLPDFHKITGFMTWLFPGVPTLFFISGFLVSLSYRGDGLNIEYLVKRILRVFPPLWACTLLTVIALFSVGYLTPLNLNWGEFVFWFIGQLTILQVYHPSFLENFGRGVINGNLWAIPVIFQFYLALPYFVKLDHYFSKKYSTNWIYMILVIFAIMNIIFHYFHNFHESVASKILFLTLIPWAFNFFLGYFFQRNFHLIKGRTIYSFLFWLGLHITVYLVLREFGFKWGRNDINPLLLTIFALTILNAAFLPKSGNKIFNEIELFLKKYDITFGVFVYHTVVINFMIHYNILENNLSYQIIFLLTVTIAISAFSMLLLEKPIKDNRNKILSKVVNYWSIAKLLYTTKRSSR
jgi:peptidoglycan/LPS O-acetylase OafA/YrhL